MTKLLTTTMFYTRVVAVSETETESAVFSKSVSHQISTEPFFKNQIKNRVFPLKPAEADCK